MHIFISFSYLLPSSLCQRSESPQNCKICISSCSWYCIQYRLILSGRVWFLHMNYSSVDMFRGCEYLHYMESCDAESSNFSCALIAPFKWEKVEDLLSSLLSLNAFIWVGTLGPVMLSQAPRTAPEWAEILGVVWVPAFRHNLLPRQRNVDMARTG